MYSFLKYYSWITTAHMTKKENIREFFYFDLKAKRFKAT